MSLLNGEFPNMNWNRAAFCYNIFLLEKLLCALTGSIKGKTPALVPSYIKCPWHVMCLIAAGIELAPRQMCQSNIDPLSISAELSQGLCCTSNQITRIFLVIPPSSLQVWVWRRHPLHLRTGSRRSALWQRWHLPLPKIRGHPERTGCRKCQTLPGLHRSWDFLLLSAPDCLFCPQIQDPSGEVKEKQLNQGSRRTLDIK